MEINPCKKCGYKHPVNTIPSPNERHPTPFYYLCLQCGNRSNSRGTKEQAASAWNDQNPRMVEASELEHSQKRLTECHELLEIVTMSSYVDEEIRELARGLLAKHQGVSNA